MDRNDRQAIEDLFGRLDAVERQSPPRDAEAEAFIRQRIAEQPAAPYYMAQTIVVQQQALEAAQARIEEGEEGEAAGAARPSGGLFGGLFGDGRPARGSVSSVGRPRSSAGYPYQAAQPGGGFLAGAAQTAIGVAGGVLLGNMIADMIGGDQATAAETEVMPDDPGVDDGGFDGVDF